MGGLVCILTPALDYSWYAKLFKDYFHIRVSQEVGCGPMVGWEWPVCTVGSITVQNKNKSMIGLEHFYHVLVII